MGKKLILVIMLCVFQMGVSLLLFPIWNRLFTEREVMHSAERFLSEAAAPVSEPDTENRGREGVLPGKQPHECR